MGEGPERKYEGRARRPVLWAFVSWQLAMAGRDPGMSDDFEAADPTPDDDDLDADEPGLLDRLRGTGVGVEDPNIVGDVGPTDVPPGRDPGSDGLFADPPVDPD